MSHIYGSLCLSATSYQKSFPQFENAKASYHTPHKFRGRLDVLVDEDVQMDTTFLPTRQKQMSIYTSSSTEGWSSEVNEQLIHRIEQMESSFGYARQLYKLYRIQQDIVQQPESRSFLSMIVNDGQHGHTGLLSNDRNFYIYGIYDVVNSGVRIVWTTDEWFVSDVRETDYTRYVFYRLPVLRDRPLFLYSQALCSKWYGWTNQFTGTDGLLKSFNALETYLYKEPEIPSLSVTNGSLTQTEKT